MDTEEHLEAIRKEHQHPMVDALSMLLSLFSSIMLLILAEKCKEIADRGYGEVVIEFRRGKPKFIKTISSEDVQQHERKGGV